MTLAAAEEPLNDHYRRFGKVRGWQRQARGNRYLTLVQRRSFQYDGDALFISLLLCYGKR